MKTVLLLLVFIGALFALRTLALVITMVVLKGVSVSARKSVFDIGKLFLQLGIVGAHAVAVAFFATDITAFGAMVLMALDVSLIAMGLSLVIATMAKGG